MTVSPWCLHDRADPPGRKSHRLHQLSFPHVGAACISHVAAVWRSHRSPLLRYHVSERLIDALHGSAVPLDDETLAPPFQSRRCAKSSSGRGTGGWRFLFSRRPAGRR